MAAVTGSIVVGATAAQLTSASNPFSYRCLIRANPANSNNVFVGFSDDVTAGSVDATDGYLLDAGDEVEIPAAAFAQGQEANTDAIWLIGGAASQEVFWICY